MKKLYRVTMKEIVYAEYLVSAESEEDASENYFDGERVAEHFDEDYAGDLVEVKEEKL